MRLSPTVLKELARLVTDVATVIYQAAGGHRVSVLARLEDEELLHPVLRWEDERCVSVGRPGVGIPRGVPVAGQAWSSPGQCFILELPSFSGRDELVRFYEAALAIPGDLAARLGPQMLNVRSILCVGLHVEPDDEPIVLSVDCFTANGFVESRPGGFVLRQGGALQRRLVAFRDVLAQELYCGESR